MASSTATLRPDILMMILEEMPDLMNGYILPRLLPIFSSGSSSGPIPKFAARRKIERLKKARYGKFPMGSSDISNGATFNCTEDGFEEPYDAKDVEQMKGLDNLIKLWGARAIQTLLLRNEKAWVDAYFGTGFFGAGYNTAGAAAWDNVSGDPMSDVAGASEAIRLRIGRRANTLVIGGGALLALRRNTKIQSNVRAVLGSTDKAGIEYNINATLLAQVFGLEQVLIGDLVYDSADEGQTASLTSVWADDKALVCYVPPASDLISTGLGRTFVWDQGLMGTNPDEAQMLQDAGIPGIILEEYGEPGDTHAKVRARQYQDTLVLNKDAGHLLTGL